jgi:membrane dipeptidase
VRRTLNDVQLRALKKSGGVVQVVAYSGFVKTQKPDSPERMAALATVRREFNLPEPPPRGQRGNMRLALAQLTAERREEFENKLAVIDKEYPGDPPASVKDLIDHIDYAVKLIGLDHVGITSDFDGGGGITGWNDASETFNVTLELVRRGYTEEQIGKLWGGNLLRVMDEVQRIASELRKTE